MTGDRSAGDVTSMSQKTLRGSQKNRKKVPLPCEPKVITTDSASQTPISGLRLLKIKTINNLGDSKDAQLTPRKQTKNVFDRYRDDLRGNEKTGTPVKELLRPILDIKTGLYHLEKVPLSINWSGINVVYRLYVHSIDIWNLEQKRVENPNVGAGVSSNVDLYTGNNMSADMDVIQPPPISSDGLQLKAPDKNFRSNNFSTVNGVDREEVIESITPKFVAVIGKDNFPGSTSPFQPYRDLVQSEAAAGKCINLLAYPYKEQYVEPLVSSPYLKWRKNSNNSIVNTNSDNIGNCRSSCSGSLSSALPGTEKKNNRINAGVESLATTAICKGSSRSLTDVPKITIQIEIYKKVGFFNPEYLAERKKILDERERIIATGKGDKAVPAKSIKKPDSMIPRFIYGYEFVGFTNICIQKAQSVCAARKTYQIVSSDFSEIIGDITVSLELNDISKFNLVIVHKDDEECCHAGVQTKIDPDLDLLLESAKILR